MSVSRFSKQSIQAGFPKQQTIWDQSTNTASMDALASIVLTSTQSYVEFTGIPATYKHLQIRGLLQENRPTYWVGDANMTINGASSGMTSHYMFGNGSSTSSGGTGSATNNIVLGTGAIGTTTGGEFAAFVIDILDYADTTKYKTIRYFLGFDTNGTGGGGTLGGRTTFGTGSYQAYTAVGSFRIYPGNNSLTPNCSFSVYGIK